MVGVCLHRFVTTEFKRFRIHFHVLCNLACRHAIYIVSIGKRVLRVRVQSDPPRGSLQPKRYLSLRSGLSDLSMLKAAAKPAVSIFLTCPPEFQGGLCIIHFRSSRRRRRRAGLPHTQRQGSVPLAHH